MYLTYNEYKGMGGTQKTAQFTLHELKAEKLIDRFTHGRIRDETPTREAVKNCVYELIMIMEADELATGFSGREIVSQSNDGVSVTYSAEYGGSALARYGAAIRIWLTGEISTNGVALLYAGVDG